jgi:hypothetical protein
MMWLEGSLENHLLWDVLQLLNDCKREGTLALESDRGTAELEIRAGLITYAKTDKNQGDWAVEEILTKWQQGRFRFESKKLSEPEMLNLSIAQAVLEASRKVGEWAEIEKLIPSTAYIPKILEAPQGEEDLIHLEQSEWKVLTQIDGTKSVAEIARDLAWSEFETAKFIFRLARTKLISITPPFQPAKEKKPHGLFSRFSQR